MAIPDSGISYRAWAATSPRAKLLLVHGLGANPSWWEQFASESLKKNFSSYAIDLRELKSFAEFFNSINILIAKMKEDDPGKKIFAVGESMGSLIILSMALKNQDIFDGIVCVSPAFNSKLPLKLKDYINIFSLLFHDRNRRCPLPVSPDMCTRDQKYLKVIEATYDKDVMATAKVLFDIFIIQLRMRLFKMRLEHPALFLVAGSDILVCPKSSKNVFRKLICKDKTIIEYPDMYHALSIELDKEKVFQDIWSWIDKRI